MANNIILDRDKHRNTRILTARGAEFGENIHCVPVIADELRHLILEYPVCLIKNHDTGQFGLYALLGLEAGENLFLDDTVWSANYVPAHLKRQPFMVAINGDEDSHPTPNNTVITIDTDNTRVKEGGSDGEPLFVKNGEPSEYLKGITDLLSSLVPGIVKTESFIKELADHDLIESIQLNISLIDGEEKKFDGLYIINEDNLQELSGDKLQEFYSKGYIQACYLLMASMGHVQKLITLKRKRLTQNNN